MSTTLWIILAAVVAIALLARRIPALHPYLEKESLAAFFLGVSSGFPYAMIGATLTTRLAQDGIDKKTVTAFTLAGFFFGNVPVVKRNFHVVIVAIIVISVMPPIIEYLRARRQPAVD